MNKLMCAQVSKVAWSQKILINEVEGTGAEAFI